MFLAVNAVVADTVEVHPGPMLMPPYAFGIITFVFLALLVLVTWAFRNMSQSHPEHSDLWHHEPMGHPGQPVIEPGGDRAEH